MKQLTRRQAIVRSVVSAGAAGMAPLFTQARTLRSDEGVLIAPSVARLIGENRMAVHIDGWVYEHERRRLATAMLARWLGLDLDEIEPLDRDRFLERTRLFGKESQRGRTLRARVAGGAWSTLVPSDDRGRVQATLVVPTAAAWGERIDVEINDRQRSFVGEARLHGPRGLSIVSDIDDTIKHTQVLNRKAMLLNTFARPFAAVQGMSDWYARIAGASATTEPVAFHYVSGSPFQLLPALQGFVALERFPIGSVHLRSMDLGPSALFSKGASLRHKHTAIERLLLDFPLRHFVLVGDSGEQDPEVYGETARRHPERIRAVLIRDLGGDGATDSTTDSATDTEQAARYARAFAGVPRERWQLFTDPTALPVSWA
jgi:hypothetical protein